MTTTLAAISSWRAKLEALDPDFASGAGIARCTPALYVADQLTKRRRDFVRAVRLWYKTPPVGQIVYPDIDATGSGNDFYRRPTTPHGVSEPETIHGAGHMNVSEDDADVRPNFQYLNGLVGVGGLKHLKSGIFDDFDRTDANQKFVFHDKDNGPP
ncbi:MAG TPA: hypothetical protein VJV97_01255 [Gemmatimonadaceae bacterium]|nr:hypothetical protein [Gemmatimonadaceae bacterium]